MKYLLSLILTFNFILTQDDYSLHFDGYDDWINISNGSITGSDSFLLYAKIKLTDFPEDDTGDPNYNIIDQANGQWCLMFAEDLQKLRIQAKTSEMDWVTATATIVENKWHELVAVYNAQAGLLQLFLDGVLASESEIQGTLVDATWLIEGVAINRQANLPFLLDRLIISQNLSLVETLQNTHLVNLDEIQPALVNYNFNTESAETVNDLSGNNNHGTINGNP